MNEDAAIKPVRDARRQISAAVDHDPRKLVEYYQQRQQKRRQRIVSRGAESKPRDEHAA